MSYTMSSFVVFVFIAVFVVFSYFLISAVNNSNKKADNKSPRIIVEAVLVAKRTQLINEHSRYYATFQFESGDRTEFLITGNEYGQFVEGDYGKLMFQGHKFLNFERTPYITTK